MAIKLNSIAEKHISVIALADDSLDVDTETYSAYNACLDESLLKFVEGKEPTRFILRRVLPFNLHVSLDSKRFKVSKSGDSEFQVGSIYDEVRYSLIDIVNPDSTPLEERVIFEKDKDGLVSISLMERLMASGIAINLFTARQAATSGKKDNTKKNS